MYYKSNPNNYTRCEECKYIDREKEECKITNDKWLVPDNAGTCHQFKEVERMEVVCINNKDLKGVLKNGEIYKVSNIKEFELERFYILENVDGILSGERFKEITGEVKSFRNYRNAKGCQSLTCGKKYKTTALIENNIEIVDNIGEIKLYPKSWFTNIQKYKGDYNLKEEVELDRQMREVSEMAKKCGISSEKISESLKKVNLTADTTKPNYYKAGKFDVIAFCFEHGLDFATGNIIKYVTRAGKKDKDKTLEDLYKGMEYLKRRIEFIESKKQG